MVTHPAQLLVLQLLGLVALAITATALYLIYRAYKRRVVYVPSARRDERDVRHTASASAEHERRRKRLLIGIAIAMLGIAFGGKYLVALFYPSAPDIEQPMNVAAATVRGASGANLSVFTAGPDNAPTVVMTHGWGADHRALLYAASELGKRYRVVLWDLSGLGSSSPTANGDYSMKTLAADLDSVVQSVKPGPVVLVGHSVGGILNIEYARLNAKRLGSDVRAIVQVNTTFTNPVETKKNAERSRKLQEPMFEPLLKLVTWLSPVARSLGWLAYQSGLAHLQLAQQSFAGNESWEQLDLMARYAYRSSPAVVAQGALAMLHWDGSDVLGTIRVPTLIISGDQDVTTLPAASERMAREIPSATHVTVSPAAHLGPVEQYGRYAQAIGSFIDRSARTSSGVAQIPAQ